MWQDCKFVEKEFSLTIQGVQSDDFGATANLYLRIPWDFHEYRFAEKSDKCCGSISASVSGTVAVGYGSDNPTKEEYQTGFLVDQDLTITRRKTLVINRAIQTLNLKVCRAYEVWSRTTDCGVRSESAGDLHFVLGTSTRGEKLWKPRVIALLKTNIDMREVEDPYA